MLRRAPLARTAVLRAGKPMARTRIRQGKTARLRRSEAVLRDAHAVVWEREMGCCWICGRPGEQVHHRRPRAMGGSSADDTNRPANLILTCASCHNWLERQVRARARDVDGLIVGHGITPPELVPIRQGTAWFLLNGDGTRTPTWPPEGTS